MRKRKKFFILIFIFLLSCQFQSENEDNLSFAPKNYVTDQNSKRLIDFIKNDSILIDIFSYDRESNSLFFNCYNRKIRDTISCEMADSVVNYVTLKFNMFIIRNYFESDYEVDSILFEKYRIVKYPMYMANKYLRSKCFENFMNRKAAIQYGSLKNVHKEILEILNIRQ